MLLDFASEIDLVGIDRRGMKTKSTKTKYMFAARDRYRSRVFVMRK